MNKTIVQILHTMEMVGFIKSNGTQCRFASLVTETPVTDIQKKSPFLGVLKVARRKGLINVKYCAAVERRVSEQFGITPGTFEYIPGKTWYKHLETKDGKALPLVEHATKDTGEYYLQFFPTHSEYTYVMPDGTPVSEDELKPWLYAKKETPSFKPVVMVVKVSNIKEIRASGVIMQAEDIDEAEALLAGK